MTLYIALTITSLTSHFIKTFKAKYNFTPKKYRTKYSAR